MNPGDYKSGDVVAWCPGCGNHGILNAVHHALSAMALPPQDVLMVSGIGQAAKLPHYVKANCFNGLHGRALPAAVAAKMVNPRLTVIVHSGDGDCYGEGGNHFMHNIRRNLDITVIVHDNQVYGLTKGQASPTTDEGVLTKVQNEGVAVQPFHPLEVAIALGAGFVARSFSRNTEHLSRMIQAGMKHKGFALIDVLQPCVVFNKKNTYSWYSERIYDLAQETGYDPTNKAAAYVKAAEWGEHIPIGLIYQHEAPSYETRTGLDQRPPTIERDLSRIDLTGLIAEFK